MSRHGRVGFLASLFACLLLTACAASGLREKGVIGDPALDDRGSPENLYIQLAVEYLRQGQTGTALTKAGHALAAAPDNPQAHNLIALIYQRLGQVSLAERHFRAAIDRQPGDPYILNAYASFLCNQGRFAPARSRYEQALANPGYATPWVALTNLGTCARQSGDQRRAETYFHRALRVNPRFGPALAALADLSHRRGRYRSAGDYLDRYFKVAQPTPRVLLLAVRVERRLGARARADTYARMLRQRYPDSPEVLQL